VKWAWLDSKQRPHPQVEMACVADQPEDGMWSGRCWLQGDLVTHALELPHQPVPVGVVGLASDNVVGAQVAVGLATAEESQVASVAVTGR